MKQFLFALSLALSGTATVSVAQSTSLLDSLDRPGETLGWEAVGRVDVPGGFCTGTLIGSDLVLTAAHCVVREDGSEITPEQIRFQAGYTNGRASAVRTATRVAVPNEYEPAQNGVIRYSNMPYDVALIRLDRPISSSEADPFRLHETPQVGDSVSVVSYGRGRSETLSRQRSCNVTQRYRGGLMSFDCAVTFGSSGAPVFIRYGNRVRILSLISGGNTENGETVSYGMELPTMVSRLRNQLRYGTQQSVPTASAKRITVGQRSSTGARFVRP